MSFLALLVQRSRWLQAPVALLSFILQRTPLLRLAATAEALLAPSAGALVKSALTLAALGAYDTVAGATVITPTPASPAKASVGVVFSSAFTITGANGGNATPGSWSVQLSTLPPGLALQNANAAGLANVSSRTVAILGTPTATGVYAVRLTAWEHGNKSGHSQSLTYTINVSAPPVPSAPGFSPQPAGKTVTVGESVTLVATVTGFPAPTLQWFKGPDPLAGKTSASLTLVNVQSGDAGVYTLVATNASAPEGVRSSPATVVVDPAPIAPVLSVSPPAEVVAGLGETVVLSVTATGTPKPVYQWSKGTVPLVGQTGPTLELGPIVFADAGSYGVVVSNSAGSRSASTRLVVTVPAPAALADPGALKTGSAPIFDLSGGLPVPAGLTYKATGLPAGLSLDPATGLVGGVITAKPGVAKVTTWAQVGALKSATLATTLTIGAFPPALAGAYEALLDTAGDTPLPAGKLGVTVANNGTFTGTLLTGDLASASVKGRVTLSADQNRASATLTVVRATPLPAYTLVFTTGPGAPFLTASLSVGATPVGSATEGTRLPASAPIGATGAYTALLTAPANLGTVAEFPLGSAHATATINAKGVLALSGFYADGVKLTASVPLGADHVARLYLKPYKLAGGYLAGSLPFTPRADAPARWHVAPADGMDLYWRKPDPTAATANYADGFGPLALSARVEPWIKPSAATPLPPLLGLPPSGDAVLDLAASGISNTEGDPYGLPAGVRFDALKNTFAVVGANPSAFTAKIVPATGAFSGSFTLKAIPPVALRKVTFTGVALQPAPADKPSLLAGGFFLVPAASPGGPILSGRVGLSVAAP